MTLDLDRDGAALVAGAALPLVEAVERALAGCPAGRAGVRLHGVAGLSALLDADGPIGAIAAARIGAARPVRAILFDKSPGANWALGWHQDRTIAVAARHDRAGYGPWSVKAGVDHVEPPFAIIAGMVTLRIHLDPVPADNAPLLVAPGSHRLGLVPVDAIDAAVARCGTAACLAERGDVWAYATPILHASAAARGHAARRVVQVDYAAAALPAPLAWLGV